MATLTAPKKTSDDAQSASKRLLNLGGLGVLEWNGRKFAVNLLWLAGDDPNASFSSAGILKSRIQSIKPDFLCARSLIIAQQGFGHLSKGHRMGMPAAAAMAADILVGEWHGVFKAENGWWYIAVHGDAIAPDGDVFFGSEEEAYQHFLAASERQRWPRSYAPKEWMIAGTNQEIDLDKLLSVVPSVFLKPVTVNALFGDNQNKLAFVVAAAALIGLVVSIFMTGIDAYMNPPRPPSPIVPMVDVAENLAPPPRYMAADLFSNRMLEIDDFPPPLLIQACLTHFETMFKSLPGWKLDSLACQDGNVTGEWIRNGARLADLADLRRRFGDDATMTFDGQTKVTVVQPLSLGDVQKLKMQVLQKEVLYALLTKRLESKGNITVEMTEVAPPPADPNNPAAVPPAPERMLAFKFETPLAAYLWADDFDIPGLKPLLLKWQIQSSVWEISGVVKYQ